MNVAAFGVYALHLLYYVGVTIFLFVLPGLGILRLLFQKRSYTIGEWVGLSSGVSISLYPILALWSYVFNIPFIPGFVLLPGILGLLATIWSCRYHLQNMVSTRSFRFTFSTQFHSISWLLVTGVIIATRLLAVEGMVAPAWGDSVHHTTIVQLILDHKGLFQSWLPYAPMQTFTYHFGYHIAMASWSWLSQMKTEQAVLIGSQMLNVLSICTLYPLAVRLAGRNQKAGIGAMIVAGLLTQMPAYYVNWGRYTQLAAQLILPVFIWLLDEYLLERTKPGARSWIVIAIVSAGLLLTHYRVSVTAFTAALAWVLWTVWRDRRELKQWFIRVLSLASASVVAILICVPWLLIIQKGRLPLVTSVISNRAMDSALTQNELGVWQSLNNYYPYFLWQLAIVVLIYGLWKRREMSIPILLWCILSFLVASPFLLGLRGTGLVTNFLLILGFYIVIALLIGWAWGVLSDLILWFSHNRVVAELIVLTVVVLGFINQYKIIDPFYQFVTPNDIRAFNWINANVPDKSRFLVNGFLAYGDALVVGSDAGWWLPFFTKREATVPPILYSTEAISIDRTFFRQFLIQVRDSHGEPSQLREILCQAKITHVFLGEKQGKGGFGAESLVPTTWLDHNSDFRLLHNEENAQIWEFNRAVCDVAALQLDSQYSN